MKTLSSIVGCLALSTLLTGCFGATATNNDAVFMPATGQFNAQDTDTEQNGQQEFQGQLDYMQGQQQRKSQQESTNMQIQNKMDQEYLQQIKQQTAKESGAK